MNGGWVDWSCMNGGWVDWSRMGCWLVSWTRVSNSLIFHISHIAAIASNISVVVNNLSATIRQGHPVVADDASTVRSLGLAKVGARVLIENTVLESIWLGWFGITSTMNWCMMNWDWVDRYRPVGGCWVVTSLCVGSGSQGNGKNGSFGKHDELLLLLEWS